jgi:hypothetical protein
MTLFTKPHKNPNILDECNMATNTRELMQYKLNWSDYDPVKVVMWFTDSLSAYYTVNCPQSEAGMLNQ